MINNLYTYDIVSGFLVGLVFYVFYLTVESVRLRRKNLRLKEDVFNLQLVNQRLQIENKKLKNETNNRNL